MLSMGTMRRGEWSVSLPYFQLMELVHIAVMCLARVRRGEERIDIVALSAAKDEGLGQTFEFVREMNESR